MINNEDKRKEFISSHKDEWKIRGTQLKASRSELSISRNEVARNIDVSSGRLRKLELGDPVMDAKLLIAAYENFIDLKIHERAIKYHLLLAKLYKHA